MSQNNRRRSSAARLLVLAVALVAIAAIGLWALNYTRQTSTSAAQPGQSSDWPTYMHDSTRTGFNSGETKLSPVNAANLKLLWKQKLGTGDILAAQPVVVSGTLYEGSWDGYLYALDTKDGSVKWKANLGKTSAKQCVPESAGVTSSAAVEGDMLYIGGGDNFFYALDTASGKTAWKFNMGDNSETGGEYNWDSPMVYNGRVYYGTSSFCDQPFPPGVLYGINTATGKQEQQVNFVPNGQLGGGIWTSPAVDEATGDIYVTVGSGDYYIRHSYSMARLDPKTLAVVDSWQIPIDQQVFDGDWGTTPTLFKDKDGKLLVGAAAKNGMYYTFRADNIAAGPVWKVRIADGGSCPQCGEGAISTGAYAYNTVFVGAGYQSIGEAQKFSGTLRALDPTTGAEKWLHPTNGWVMPAIAVANGLVVAAGDDTVEVVNAATGELLWEYAAEATIYAPPIVAGGVLYVASTDGYVYAFSAGPYPDNTTAYKVDQVGTNPPNFTPFRTPVAATPLAGDEQCFQDTGKCVHGDFLQFWKDKGGLDRFGPAVTNELNEAGRRVQYFRNTVLELHPKADGSGDEVRLGRLDFRLFYFTPTDPHFDPADPAPGATYFSETHHNLSEPFLTYWKTHGDVAGLGYPVSEPFDGYVAADGQVRHIQYFERARLEIVKDASGNDQVQLGAMGLDRYKQRYGKLP